MSKKKIFAIILFIFIGLFMFTFANPSENTPIDNVDIDLSKDTEEIVKQVKIDVEIKTEKEIKKVTYNKGTTCENGTEVENGAFEVNSNGTYIVCVETTDDEVESKTIEITNIDNTRPRISVTPSVVKILLGTDYDVMTGVSATDNNGTPEVEANLTNTTSLSLGSHTVTYTATDEASNKATAEREIKVYDPSGDEDNDGFINKEEIENGTDPDDETSHGETTVPVINVKDLTIEVFGSFLEDATTVLDIHDTVTDPTKFTVTGELNTNKLGVYTLEYSITDRYGKTGTATRKITVVDTVKPIINLKNTKLEINSKDTLDPMIDVTATDNYDGDITKNVVTTPSEIVDGKYIITYAVKDSSNNVAIPVLAEVTVIYNITVSSNVEGNEIKVVETAKAGDKVDFDTLLATGYEIDSIKLDGKEINENTFTMPDKDVTIELTVKKINYTITVNESENGLVTSDKDLATMGETVTLTVDPATGYKLKSLTVKDANNKNITVTNETFTMPANNVTVSATFEADTYLATFKIDGIECGTSNTVFGETIVVPSTCKTTKLGHNFSDWDETLVMDTEGKEINGTFSKGTYNATFEIDGKICGTSNTVFGETITVPGSCKASEGYHLNDWDKDLVMDAEGKTITTTSVKNDYTVTIADTTNGAVETSKNVANINDEITIATTPSTGYEVDTITVKDASNNNVTVTNNKFTMPASNVTVTVTFKKINYTVTVNNTVNGTVKVNKASANINDEIKITINPATGYKLKSLIVKDADNKNITVTDNKFTMPASNVTVTVEYEKDTYTATFVIGNTTCGTNQVVFGEAVTIPETCVADTGYSLGNWDDELVMDEEGKTFTTTSTAIDYTIIKVSTNGTIGVKTTANYNEEVTLTLTPTEGYELDTLTVKDASNNEVAVTNNKFTMPASNVTVTATFKKSTYTATFVIGNTTCGTKQVVFGEVVGAPVLTNCVLEEGYEIKNWSPVIGNMPAGDTTYKATVGLKQFTVTFVDYNNTQIGSTQVVDYNASATAPTIPTRQGYTFSSWDKSFTNVKSNITVKALYTANLKEIRLEKANSNINLAFQEESVVNIKENIKVVKVYYDDNEIIATDNEFNITGFSTSTIGTFNMRATLIENNMNSNALEYRITSYPVFNTLFKVDYNNTGKYLRTKNRDCTSKCDSGKNVSYVENVNFNFLEITEYYDQIIDTKEVRIKFVGESGYTVLNKSPYFVSGYMNSYSNLIRWNTSTQSVSHPVILAAGSLQSINLGYSPYDNVGVYKEGTDAVPTGKAIDKVYIQYRIDTDNDRETNDEVDMYVIFKYQSDGTFKAIDGN